MDHVDCQVFADQLDAMLRGELSEEGVAQLRAHAAACPTCAAMARVGEHLATPPLEELEARVPDAWVASMGADVEAALRVRRRATRPGPRWLVPALAAAVVTLLFGNALTLRALGGMSDRQDALQEQIFEQQRRLTEYATGRERTGSGGEGGFGRSASLRSLDVDREVTVADLRALLAELPAGTSVIRASRTRALVRSRLVPPAWRDVLARLDTGGDVTAEALLGVLEELRIPETTAVPARRLLDLLS